MNRKETLGFSLIAAVGLAVSPASAQLRAGSLQSQMVGWWRLVSVEHTGPDGHTDQTFGPNPKGMLVFNGNGVFSDVKEAAGRANFKSDNRGAATLEESKEATKNAFFQFGRWSVDEAKKSFIFHAEGALVPNIEGADSTRVVTLVNAEELKFTDAGTGGSTTAAVGGTTEFSYRRIT